MNRLLGNMSVALLAATVVAVTASAATPRHGMVVAQCERAAQVGAEVLREGGNAVDAAVATAFALAVTHPAAGNIGGGGFLVLRTAAGDPVAYDFRETAPATAHPRLWLDAEGRYDEHRHHLSHAAVGVPGMVAGLHLAWREQGRLPWERLVAPAVSLAADGVVVSAGLAASLEAKWERLAPHPASAAQFGRGRRPLAVGDTLRQPDLARTLQRIAAAGPDGFYRGPTADLIVAEMDAQGGLLTHRDLAAYRAVRREPIQGTYRGCGIIGMPPPSSGGVVLVAMLNVLEGFDLAAMEPDAAATIHILAETMRLAYADRARYLGDPEANPDQPLDWLLSPTRADSLRATIRSDRAGRSHPQDVQGAGESDETTHLSVLDAEGAAVALTTTLEYAYGSGIVVPGAGFLLNNEMGDFNAGPGLTDSEGLIGTPPNLARPGRRMLSSMTPTIVTRDDAVLMVTGSLGGRTIINTVLQTIVNVVDHGLGAQAAVDAGRIHHQWLPDRIVYEPGFLAPGVLAALRALGHTLHEGPRQGVAEVIVVAPGGVPTAGVDRRAATGGAAVP